jgi:hypothetical protein
MIYIGGFDLLMTTFHNHPCSFCKYVFLDELTKTIMCVNEEKTGKIYDSNDLSCSKFNGQCHYCVILFRERTNKIKIEYAHTHLKLSMKWIDRDRYI